jgi:hypothetical protein
MDTPGHLLNLVTAVQSALGEERFAVRHSRVPR